MFSYSCCTDKELWLTRTHDDVVVEEVVMWFIFSCVAILFWRFWIVFFLTK